ncbi:MAG: hypothetical protein ACYC5Q_04755 [Thermoleophilia bacterium]
MSTGDIVTLVAAVLALAGSLITVFLGTRLALRKEKRQLLWSKELDRFFALEELAGELVEFLGGYRPIPDDRTELAQKLSALADAGGHFARYPKVRQAIRDLHNTLNRMFVAKRDARDEEENVRGELDPAYRTLLRECDKVLERDARGST